MPITGTVAVSGIIAPTSVLDTYPVTDPQWGLGGLRSVATTTDRNNIEYPRRQEGMMVYVQDQDSYYALVGGTSNTDWILFNQSQSGQSQSGFFSSDAEINYPVGGFSASGFTGDRLLLATGPANDPFRNYIRYKEQWFQTGVAGVASQSITGDTISAGYGIGIVRGGNSVTVNNTGVTGFNGLSGNVSMTGAGALFGFGNNAIGVRNASASVTGVASFDPRYFTVATTGHVGLLGAYQVTGQTVVSGGSSQLVTSSGNTVTIDNRVASLTVTGVASFDPRYFTVGTTGHVGLTATFFSAESEQNYPVGGFSASGFTGDRLLLATGPANDPFRSYIRYENQWFQTGVVGVVGVTVDFGAVQGKPKNLITARLATNSLTGVASFASQNFKVNSGRVTLSTTPFVMASSGLGATGDEDGNLISLYLDLNNVADYDSGKTLGVSDAVFVYDTDESGIIKTKKTTIGKMLYDTDAVFSSSTQNQLQKSKSGLYEEIQYGVVLGSIEPTSLGLIIGASAYEYFTQNTIKSFNGCTGDISITGTANQVIVTGISCSQIVIGLPTSITITGTMNADRFIGRMDGGAF